jgi:hypothetical protein
MEAFREMPARAVLPEKFRTDEGFKKWFALTSIQLGLEEAVSKRAMFTEQRRNFEVAGEPVVPVPDVSLPQRQRVVDIAQHKLFGSYMDALNASTERLEPGDYAAAEKRLRSVVASYAHDIDPFTAANMSEDEQVAYVLANAKIVEARSSGRMPVINEYLALQEAKMLDELMLGDNKGELYVHRQIQQSGNTHGMAALVGLQLVREGLAELLTSAATKYDIRTEAGGTDLTVNVDATDGRSFNYVGKNLQNGTYNVRAQGSGSELLNIDDWMHGFKPTPP